jgi:hypothetical protein
MGVFSKLPTLDSKYPRAVVDTKVDNGNDGDISSDADLLSDIDDFLNDGMS